MIRSITTGLITSNAFPSSFHASVAITCHQLTMQPTIRCGLELESRHHLSIFSIRQPLTDPSLVSMMLHSQDDIRSAKWIYTKLIVFFIHLQVFHRHTPFFAGLRSSLSVGWTSTLVFLGTTSEQYGAYLSEIGVSWAERSILGKFDILRRVFLGNSKWFTMSFVPGDFIPSIFMWLYPEILSHRHGVSPSRI